jgi:predicted Zn-dependent protease
MSRARPVATAVLAAALVAACATTTSPTGRTQYVGAISQAQLDQLGAKAFAEQKASKPQASDAAQRRYVACVTDSIVAGLPAQWRAYRWESAVFVDDEPNAFALPGGKVGVYTGIFRVARDQDQLAAVIAHEVGHVVARHHDERITRQVGAAGAVNLLGALAGDYGQVATQGGSILAQAGFLLPNSRAQESEADVVGQRLMAEAGYDPRGAVVLWRNMAEVGGARPPRWLSTHPDPASRLRELDARAASLEPVMEQARRAGRMPRCR